MAKSIANERISYKVIPQSLPKIKFWQNQLNSGAAAIESGTSKKQYSIHILFCIGYYSEAFAFFYSKWIAIDLTKMQVGGILKEMEMPDSVGRLHNLAIKPPCVSNLGGFTF